MDCDKCDETDIRAATKVKQLRFNNGMVSTVSTNVTLCNPCYYEVVEDENYETGHYLK